MRRVFAALLLLVTLTPLASVRAQPAVTMRESVYEKLSEAQEAGAQGDYEKAFEALRDVEKMRNLEPYERAQLHTAFGFLHFSREAYEQSIASYRKVLDETDIPDVLISQTRYTLAQLRFQVGDYDAAVVDLTAWLEAATNPGPEPYVLLGQAHYQAGRPREAIAPVERAIAIAGARDLPAKEEWYGLLRVFHHELENYPALLEVLEYLVRVHPKKEYWLHLASVYGELDDDKKRLSTYELAHAQGFLETDSEIRLLAQLLLQAGVPHRAGVVLAAGIEAGRVEGSADDFLLLSQAWTIAREPARAIAALRRAAALTEDGEIDARLAQSHAQLRDWQAAIEAAHAALEKGVRDPHDLHVLVGMANVELRKYDAATSAFREAQAMPDGRAVATRWIAYVENEVARLNTLQRALR